MRVLKMRTLKRLTLCNLVSFISRLVFFILDGPARQWDSSGKPEVWWFVRWPDLKRIARWRLAMPPHYGQNMKNDGLH